MSETTVKKSVTIRRSIVEQIEERVGAGGFSSFVNAAAEHWLALLKAQEIVEDCEQTNGPLPEDLVDEVSRTWHGE